jgi:hypothetical protein
MTCPKCNSPLTPNASFCGRCGTSVKDVAAGGIVIEPDPPQAVQRTAPVGPPVATTSFGAQRAGQPRFRLAADETVLKAYEAVQLRTGLFRRKRGQGTLFVTDARVVFYAWVFPRGTQRASWLLQQTKLEDISGLSAYVTRRFSLFLLLLTLIFGAAAVAALVVHYVPEAIAAVVLAVLCMFFLFWDASRRGSVQVVISSRESDNSPIGFGHGPRSGLGVFRRVFRPVMFFFPAYTAFDVMVGDPAEDADKLLHELGALILDLQTRGKMAYPHWGITVAAGNGHVGSVQ